VLYCGCSSPFCERIAHCVSLTRLLGDALSPQEWTDYRNPYRYFDSLRLLFLGRTSVLRRVWVIVGLLTLVATAVCTFNHFHPAIPLGMSPWPIMLLSAFVSLQVNVCGSTAPLTRPPCVS
jgi:hypothetical protein